MTIKTKKGILETVTVSSDLSTYLGAAREILHAHNVYTGLCQIAQAKVE
jgi:hypothetical protein